jgi:hypothetical protein
VGVIGALTASQLAFLTDEESTYNTFTIGDVGLDVIEPNYPGNDSDEVTHIVPNQEIAKDPELVNTGDNDAVAFAEFSVPIVADLVVADSTGKRQEAADTEIFQILHAVVTNEADGSTTTTYEEGINSDWTLLYKTYYDKDGNKIGDSIATDTFDQTVTVEGAAYATYTVAYTKPLLGTDDSTTDDQYNKTTSVFDKVRLVNLVEGYIDNTAQSIEVSGLAIQSDWISSDLIDENHKVKTDDDGIIADADLKTIYNMYMTQNEDIATSSDANSSNALDLQGNSIVTKLSLSGYDTKEATWTNDKKEEVTANVGYISTFPQDVKVTVAVTTTDDGEVDADGQPIERTVTVESSNPNVATVSAVTGTGESREFTISAKEAGYTTITVKTDDGAVVTKQFIIGNPSEDVPNNNMDKDNTPTEAVVQ